MAIMSRGDDQIRKPRARGLAELKVLRLPGEQEVAAGLRSMRE